jgi:hypothetical protein
MRRRRLFALLLLVTYLPACHSWRADTTMPQELIGTNHPNKIRVVRIDGTNQVLHHALIRSDTLWGIMPEPPIALSDVQAVQTRQDDAGKLLLLTGGIVAGFFLVVGTMTPPVP